MDFEAVAEAIRFANDEAIEPRFRELAADDIEAKGAGEVVTVADRECERLLGPLLREVIDVPVLGEEAVELDPGLVEAAPSWESWWLVDPIDGTANFAAGDPRYAIMVAHIRRGEAVASWMYQPQAGRMAIAERGAGSTVDGQRVVAPAPGPDPADWGGVVKDRFLPPSIKEAVLEASRSLGPRHLVTNCAGFEYPDLVAGDHTFLAYWRTLPWDHAPGILFAIEAGCLALRPDLAPWALHDGGDGLVVAHETVASTITAHLFGQTPP